MIIVANGSHVQNFDNTPFCHVVNRWWYRADPNLVAQYATRFILAQRRHRMRTAIKHFPGHGFANKDSHIGMNR
ncbi:MAG: hypothetical protein JKY49_00775 [Cohaesibacteraceae bacterium]|nr:hypothetical protein [Cohaesibacteraceae bacterium]